MCATIRHKKLAKTVRNCATLKEAKIKAGYSESYAKNASIKKTKGYKEAIVPVLERYLKEEQRLLEAMNKKNLDKEQYRTQIDAIDKVRKQIQLLSGKPTERTENTFDDEQITKIASRIFGRKGSDGDTSSKE